MPQFKLADVFSITGVGLIITGSPTAETILPGQTAEIDGVEYTIVSIEAKNQPAAQAAVGENVGLHVKSNRPSTFFSPAIKADKKALKSAAGTIINFL